jgi:hypothetical protein
MEVLEVSNSMKGSVDSSSMEGSVGNNSMEGSVGSRGYSAATKEA